MKYNSLCNSYSKCLKELLVCEASFVFFSLVLHSKKKDPRCYFLMSLSGKMILNKF